ncbi:hypothetical protein AAF712_000684 [Marasmius tenuissimus]|uniref:F-box domain-containing protein n=1 Tax=Marasmius tenuissimus TaxID=585030 RepID=A0ABR3ACT7_9AGAR
MSTTFVTLPNEIVHHIAHLAGNDVQNLRAVNKSINVTVGPIMWETFPIILHLNRENLSLSMTMLEEFSRTSVDKFRRLEIKSLNPSKEHHPPRRGCQRRNGDGTRIAIPPEPEDTEEIIEARRKLSEILPKALAALKGLRSVKWYVARGDPHSAYEPVFESLGHLLDLADVEIVTSIDPSKLPLHQLTNGSLQRLSIKQENGLLSDFRRFISSLATVFVQNPLLIHLELITPHGNKEPFPFQDLFQNTPSNTLRLHSLRLSGWSIQASPQLRPHLQSLNSIELPRSWKSDLDALWKLLNGADPNIQLPLRRVSCGTVSEELLDFLRSPSVGGLETLEFRHAGADTDERSDEFARRFYNDILPRHQNTLRELSLIPTYTGGWTIGSRNLEVFDEFQQLTTLSVGPDPDEIHPGAGENDIVASFIARAMRLPNLSIISLHPVASKSSRFARCGFGRIGAAQHTMKRMQESIEKAAVPRASHLPCNRLRIVLAPRRYQSTTGAGPEVDGEPSTIMRFELVQAPSFNLLDLL